MAKLISSLLASSFARFSQCGHTCFFSIDFFVFINYYFNCNLFFLWYTLSLNCGLDSILDIPSSECAFPASPEVSLKENFPRLTRDSFSCFYWGKTDFVILLNIFSIFMFLFLIIKYKKRAYTRFLAYIIIIHYLKQKVKLSN